MLFNSFEFLLFFPIVTILYFLLKHEYRWFLLLVASCFFYMFFKPVYILILFFTIIIDYYAGLFIEKADNKEQKKKLLLISIIANVGVLAIFKYYNFFNLNITSLAEMFQVKNPIPYLNIVLPIGLSFHTFQAMSYTIEVYRGNQKAEKHFGIYALYVMFYPQLVAGPIERPQHILHQFYEKHFFEYERVVKGLRLMLWGFFKKMVIADNIGVIADNVFNNPSAQNSITYILGTLFFTIQIYCDFSGYSDIAIGSAKVMGFELMKNFNVPYISKSIKEFWSRWHISLSTWFRDYVYISLGGNRVSKTRMYFNLIFVFLISGLWHGANWTFIVWGALHGSFIVLETIFGNNKINNHWSFTNILHVMITFALAALAWVFFRANSVKEALTVIYTIFFELSNSIKDMKVGKPVFAGLKLSASYELVIYLILIALFYMTDAIKENAYWINLFNRKKIMRYTIYAVLLFSVFIFGFIDETPFIYFQF